VYIQYRTKRKRNIIYKDVYTLQDKEEKKHNI